MTERADSVTEWIEALKRGDSLAAERIWERYFDALVRYARRRLAGTSRKVADEEDLALSAMHSLCRAADAGRLTELNDRVDLWKLLVRITQRKAVDHRRQQARQKRGSGQVRGESMFEGARPEGAAPANFDQFEGGQLPADVLLAFEEEQSRLLRELGDERLRAVALARLEGLSVEETAERLSMSVRSVERKLQKIRDCWSREAEDDNP